ncbi:MAG: peptidoglycan DD-metalloendopeptidase family protein [Anaerolineaceae bacterium]|nr:peptidoglycan DD-metalloendopeptidase family protein [Anaerolineaceae bacterium]
MPVKKILPLDDYDEGRMIEERPSPKNIDSNSQTSLWEKLVRMGLGESALKIGTAVVSIIFFILIAWVMNRFYVNSRVSAATGNGGPMNFMSSSPTQVSPDSLTIPLVDNPIEGVTRQASIHTTIPNRSRTDIQTYIVEKGDTLFGIAEKFTLKPETIFWSNRFTMGNDPENLIPGMNLNILPVEGAYHRWSAGEGLNGVASFYGVAPEDIINYPGNNLSLEAIGDLSNPNIEPGTMLVVPDGYASFVNLMPSITRANPGAASGVGPGACGQVIEDGAYGVGMFIWPTISHAITGYDWSPETNHNAIDLGGKSGEPIFASDNGIVIYAGWSNVGYGYLVIIDHGNGFVTYYAHLLEDSIIVQCGQSVWQTNVIGALGSTGNSSGPHLHFEIRYNGTPVNPKDYLPAF